MISFAIYNKKTKLYMDGFQTVSQLAGSHKFPSNADDFYEFVMVNRLSYAFISGIFWLCTSDWQLSY